MLGPREEEEQEEEEEEDRSLEGLLSLAKQELEEEAFLKKVLCCNSFTAMVKNVFSKWI
jgi:hypothetical protein